jgi:hypothetical protein
MATGEGIEAEALVSTEKKMVEAGVKRSRRKCKFSLVVATSIFLKPPELERRGRLREGKMRERECFSGGERGRLTGGV